MNKKILKAILLLVCLLWVVFVLADYMNKHPRHVLGFQYFKMGSFVLGLGVLYGIHIAVEWFLKRRGKNLSPWINGLWVVFIFLMSSLLEYTSFARFLESKPETHHYFVMVGRTLRTIGGGFLVVFAALALGNFILNRLSYKWPGRSLAADIAIGALVIVQLIILLASLGIYHSWIIAILLVGAMALNYNKLLPLLKISLLKPWLASDRSFLVSLGLLILIISFASINLQSILAPFPFGFDSRNVYLNISNLVAENGALIAGFQPYPWSLFLSLGTALFGTGEMTIFLSFFSGILCLMYIFRLCGHYFDLNQTLSLLAVTLFFITPAITNQFFIELKVDFGLLLYQLLSLDIILHLLKNGYIEQVFQKTKDKSKNGSHLSLALRYLLLLGIISGFALSIKLTHFFILFAIIIAVWSRLGGMIGFYSSFSILMAIILILKLDDLSGLRQYHLGVNQLKWIMFILGLGLIAVFLYLERKAFLQSLKITVLVGICSLVMLSPWMIKGYVETGSTNPKTIIMGSGSGPHINLRQLENRYFESLNGE